MSVALNLDEDYADTMYGYQIVNETEGFRVWKSTGPIRGHYIHKGHFADFIEALDHLVEHIKDGE